MKKSLCVALSLLSVSVFASPDYNGLLFSIQNAAGPAQACGYTKDVQDLRQSYLELMAGDPDISPTKLGAIARLMDAKIEAEAESRSAVVKTGNCPFYQGQVRRLTQRIDDENLSR